MKTYKSGPYTGVLVSHVRATKVFLFVVFVGLALLGLDYLLVRL